MAINYHNVEQELNKADYIVRIMAYLIDVAILGALTILINLIMIVSSYIITDSIFWGTVGYHLALMLLIVIFASMAYGVVSLCSYGATVGKHLMKIEVVSLKGRELTFKQVVTREFVGKTMCKLTGFTGFATMFYNEEGFGLHDKLAGTMVIQKGEDLMELVAEREAVRKVMSQAMDDERYNRIYNRGINARLRGTSGEEVQQQNNWGYNQQYDQGQVVPNDPSQLRMQMSQFAEQVVVPQDSYIQPMEMYNPEYMYEGQPMVMENNIPSNNMMQEPMYMGQNYEMGGYQEALQSVVDEQSLMEECQQHLQFHI